MEKKETITIERTTEYTAEECFQYLINSGKIDLSGVQAEMEMTKRKELLEKHPYDISLGKDGYWHTYLPDDSKKYNRRSVKRKNKKDIEDIVAHYWKQKIENPTIEEVFNEWNDRRLALKKISAATHLRNKQIYNRHYAEFGKNKIKDVKPSEIVDFLEKEIADKELTAKAFAGLKSITKFMLKRAKRRELITFNVEEMLQDMDISDSDFKKTIKSDEQEVFNEEETDKIMNYLLNSLDTKNIGILLMFLTGIRVGELVALKHSDFNGDCSFNIRRTETRYCNENGKYVCEIKDFPKTEAGLRTVVIPSDFAWIERKIKLENPFGEYVFVDKKGERLTTARIRKRLYYNCEKLEIPLKSPHKIRKTYGTILLDNNVDNIMVLEQMGHTDIRCTEMHYHRNRKRIDQRIEAISNVPEFLAVK